MTREPEYGVCVVGGGIHGAGVAQAAAAAGQRALLLEERSLASGTSSRSSKLIHGGLRYLESGQLGLVRESLLERAILLRIAPRLVHLVPFIIPIYRATRRRAWQIRTGLSMYAVLGGLVPAARFSRVPKSEWSALDGLATDGLHAVFRYFDGQTDDAALVHAVAASARSLGAEILCPARFDGAARDGDAWRVRLSAGGREREVRARTLVNAAGPWIDSVQARIEPAPPRPAFELVGGAHAEVPGKLERGIYYTEASDGRAVFMMPWKERTLVGTTETPWRGDPGAVEPTRAEIDYLLSTFARYFPRREAGALNAWAGLRVLPSGKGTAFDRPREVVLVTDESRGPTLVAIYGGKLTGYRSTAARVLALLALALPAARQVADTAELPLEPVAP